MFTNETLYVRGVFKALCLQRDPAVGGESTGRQEALRDSLNTLLVLVFFWDLWTLRKIRILSGGIMSYFFC